MYKSKNHSKYSLKAHLVFTTKYRKKLFDNQSMVFELKRKLQEIADRPNFEIELMEVHKDHIHILVNYEPNVSIVQIVRRLKQESRHHMWIMFEKELSKIYWKNLVCFGLKDTLYVVLEKVQVMELFKNISGYRDKVIHIAQLKTEHLSGLKCVKAFNFMIKNAIRKLRQEDAKTLEELRTKLKERTSDKYAREGVWKSTFLFDTEANVFTLLLLSSNSLFSSKNDEKEGFFL